MNEQLVIEIIAEIDKLKAELTKGEKEVEKFSKNSKKKFEDFNTAMKSVGDTANKAVGIAAGALTAAAGALLGVSAATEEYRANQAKLDAAFQTAGASAFQAQTTYNELYRVLGDDGQAVEAAAHLAQLTTKQNELAEWTTICQGVYATFGDSLPIEGLTEAANETAKVGQVTGGLADALNWAGISEDAFNEKLAACNTEAEREKLIRDTLNSTYSKAAENYEEVAKETLAQNEAQASLNESMAELGASVAPIVTALTELATTLMEELSPAIADFMENYGTQLEEGLAAIGDAIGVIIGFIVDNIEIIGTIAGVILAIVAAINLYNAAMAIYNIVTAPVNLIIIAIVAAIALLTAAIVWLVENWDLVKDAAINCWEKIKEIWNSVATWFSENVIEPVAKFFSELWQSIVDIFNKVKEWFSDKFNQAASGIKSAFASIGAFFSGIWSSIVSIFSKVGSWFSSAFSSAWSGIKNAFSSVGSFFSGIWENIKSIFSKVGTAIADGIKGAVSKAVNSVLSTACRIINGFIAAINIAIEILNAIPGVSINPIGELSVPKMAKGGVVDSATLALIGEQGKEMVMPLENNLQYLDKLAGMISERMGGGNTPIVLNVDGKVFAQTAINTINRQTRQTGKLALNLV